MNKRIFILISAVLAVGIVVAGVLYARETGKLEDALAEISGLEEALTAAETEVSILEEALAAAEAEVSILEAELALQPVTFPDLNLLAAIREAIDKPQGPIYTSDLETLTTLEARERGISDLTGLEYCVNLEVLYLRNNFISDISPLSGLTKLRNLDLDGNNASDISPLSGLTKLVSLSLEANNISDISPLSGLTGLDSLDLDANNISDISALAGLTNLGVLTLEANNISDISVLVENSLILEWGALVLLGNPLSATSINVYIPQIEERLVYVTY